MRLLSDLLPDLHHYRGARAGGSRQDFVGRSLPVSFQVQEWCLPDQRTAGEMAADASHKTDAASTHEFLCLRTALFQRDEAMLGPARRSIQWIVSMYPIEKIYRAAAAISSTWPAKWSGLRRLAAVSVCLCGP